MQDRISMQFNFYINISVTQNDDGTFHPYFDILLNQSRQLDNLLVYVFKITFIN